jgi:hypothetical protein
VFCAEETSRQALDGAAWASSRVAGAIDWSNSSGGSRLVRFIQSSARDMVDGRFGCASAATPD